MTTATPITTMDDLDAVAQSLLEPLFPTAKSIRLLGVTLSSFIDDEMSAVGHTLQLPTHAIPSPTSHAITTRIIAQIASAVG